MKQQKNGLINTDRAIAYSSKCETAVFEIQTTDTHTGTPLPPLKGPYNSALCQKLETVYFCRTAGIEA